MAPPFRCNCIVGTQSLFEPSAPLHRIRSGLLTGGIDPDKKNKSHRHGDYWRMDDPCEGNFRLEFRLSLSLSLSLSDERLPWQFNSTATCIKYKPAHCGADRSGNIMNFQVRFHDCVSLPMNVQETEVEMERERESLCP